MNDLNQNIDHDLLMAFLSGNASSEQIENVNNWLGKSEKNSQYLEHLENVWIETGKLNPSPVAVNTDDAWNKLSNRIYTDQEKFNISPETTKKRKQINYYISAAAVIILITSFYFILNFTNQRSNKVEYSSIEKVLEKKLPDGSFVSLNKNSSLKFAENNEKNIRECILEGEAFFDVEQNKTKPFVIHTQETSIKVLGTSFNVNSRIEEISVSVATGKVLFYTIDEIEKDTVSITLLQGEKGIYNTKLMEFKKVTPPENDLYWLNKTLVFQETQMYKVIEILNSAYDVKITLNDNIKSCIYSGTFKNESIEMVLKVLSESFNLTISKENETYNLYGEGC